MQRRLFLSPVRSNAVGKRTNNSPSFQRSSSSFSSPTCSRIAMAYRGTHHLWLCRSFSEIATRSRHGASSQADYDVVIVGGGVVGCALANQLKANHNMRIALIEAGKGPLDTTGVSSGNQAVPHPRSYALSPASMKLLFNDCREKQRGGYYDSMQVWEADQPASLLLSTQDLPAKTEINAEESSFLGCCIEDSALQNYLWQQLKRSSDNVTIFSSTTLSDIQGLSSSSSTGWVEGSLVENSGWGREAKSLDTSRPARPIRTRLLVAADGGNSAIRKHAGIEMASYDYGQTALTFTVQFDRPVRQSRRAYQRFLATGPLALLPTWSDHNGVIVWSTTPAEVQQWKDTTHPAALVSYLNSLLQTGPEQLPPLFSSPPQPSMWSNLMYGVEKVIDTVQYGTAMAGQQSNLFNDNAGTVFQAPPVIQSIVSPQFSFPLSCQLPIKHYIVGKQLALVGDAAHTVHPMAGQGLNLGLQDVAALVRCIDKAVSSGMEVGSFLTDYQASRHEQVSLTVAGIHSLQQMFSGQSAASKHIKSVGMSFIQNLGPARRALVYVACHGVAAVPAR